MYKHYRLIFIVELMVFLVACAGPIKRADEYAAQDEWMKAVIEYRKAYAKEPGNVEYKSRLKQTELKAADFYYQRGARMMEQGNLDGALVQFQQGLAAVPDHSKLLQAMNEALARKEANTFYEEGRTLLDAGKSDEAMRKFKRALEVYPDHKDTAAALSALRKQENAKYSETLALSSRNPITLNFRQTDLKQAFEFIAKSFGINVMFDEAVRSVPVTLFAKDVTFEQSLSLLLATTKTFYKKIGPNSILIAPDITEKRGQYEDYLVRTFQLNSIRAKDMAEILKGLITIKKIIINEQLNTITVRDTEEIISLAGRIIENNDRKPAEMILEVEILEVNRTKAEKLGLDFGTYQVTGAVPPYSLTGSLRKAADTGTLTIPSVTFRFFKQDVDAKTLANPKIRVLSGKSAKIHIGDRVPLRAAVIQDATGQVRTTFDYHDIGIRLTAEPTINLDNSTSVKLGLEVSSLGENLGTTNEPAYRIGTRNAETYMLLRDGETAILGGLIRDEERNTRVRVPGFGDIPLVGALFTSYDDSIGRTDVLLTITPRVVRGWDIPSKAAREFYSGTENVYSDKPLFTEVNVAENPSVRTDAGNAAINNMQSAPATSTTTSPAPGSAATTENVASAPVTAAPLIATPPAIPVLSFAEPVYEVTGGREFEVKLLGSNIVGMETLPMEILYNPQNLSFVRAERSSIKLSNFDVQADTARGLITANLAFDKGTTFPSNVVLASIFVNGARPGVSYLVYRVPAIKTASGVIVNAQVRASRVVIK